MASQVGTMTLTTDARIERYRTAERRLWAEHGLSPTELEVALPSGGRLRVQDVGTGEPIVYVHGTGGSGAYFAPLVAALPGFRHVLIDRPGWVTSSAADFRGRDLATIASEVVGAVADHLRLDRVHLVGASIGDLWAVRFAMARPDRIGRVVLLGGGPISPEIEVPPFIRLLRSPLGNVIVRLPERPGMFRKQLAGMGHADSVAAGRIGDGFVDWHGALTRETGWGRAERAMVQGIVGRDGFVPGLVPSTTEVASLSAPVLMVVGSRDPVGTADVWRRFVQGIPGARLELVDGGGHLVWLDDPAGVGGRIGRFLRG